MTSNSLQLPPGRRSAEQIAQFYTREILSGALPPGTRLPASNEIARTWSVGATVVQRAMRRLVAAGLVDRERKSGTVVRNHSERALIGLVIGPSLADETAYVYRSMVTVLESIFNGHLLSLRVYDGVHPMSLRITESFHPLDLLNIDRLYYQFKGLIFIDTGPNDFPEMAGWEIPQVFFSSNPARHTDFVYNVDAMTRTVLEEMAQRGARRITVVSTSAERDRRVDWQIAFDEHAERMGEIELEHLTLPLVKRGRYVEEQAFQMMGPLIADWRSGRRHRPDVLVVMDDIVARGVCMGLLQGQVEVPGELKVVVTGADTVVHHYGMPVYRFEWKVIELTRQMEALLWARIAGEKEPLLPPITGHFKVPSSALP